MRAILFRCIFTSTETKAGFYQTLLCLCVKFKAPYPFIVTHSTGIMNGCLRREHATVQGKGQQHRIQECARDTQECARNTCLWPEGQRRRGPSGQCPACSFTQGECQCPRLACPPRLPAALPSSLCALLVLMLTASLSQQASLCSMGVSCVSPPCVGPGSCGGNDRRQQVFALAYSETSDLLSHP